MTSNGTQNNNQVEMGIQNGNQVNLDSLIRNVKAEDDKNLRISKSFLWVYIILAIIYAGLMVLNPDSDIKLIDRISGAFYLASMIVLAYIFKVGLKEYRSIDYTLPLIEMLRGVAKRYQLRARKFIQLSIPILLMDVGLTLSFYNDLLPMEPINRVLIIQVIYIPVMTISGFIGYLVWRKKQKPLRDNALILIDELERE